METVRDKPELEKLHPKSVFAVALVWALLIGAAAFFIYRCLYYEPPHWYTSAVAFSPDGKLIAVGVYRWEDAYDSENLKFCISGIEQTVKLLDAETGKELQTLVHLTHEGTFGGLSPDPVSWLSFSPNGSLLAIGTWDGQVLLWDVGRQQFRPKSFVIDQPRVRSVKFSPDGEKLAIVYETHVEVRKLSSPEEPTFLSLVIHPDNNSSISTMRPGSVAFSQDGSRTVTGDIDSVDVSDAETGHLLHRHEWDGPTGEMYANPWDERFVHRHSDGSSSSNAEQTEWVALSPDGETLAVNGHGEKHGGRVKLLDFETGKQRVKIDCTYGSMQFSPDGTLLAVGGQAGLHLIDPLQGSEVKALRGSAPVLGIDFSPNGKRVAAGDTDGKLTLWDDHTGQRLWSIRVAR